MHDTQTLIERPQWACILCPPPRQAGHWRPADPGYRTDSPCLDRLRERLQDVVRRYLLLNPRPGANGDHRGRGAPGFGSRAPASDHVIAMRDPRSSAVAHVWLARDGRVHQEAERPPLSVFVVLDTLAWDVAEQRGIDGPEPSATVPELGRWIDRHLDWITRNDIAADVDQAVRGVLAQLKPVTGEPGRKHVGECPNTIDDEDGTRECGARLYAPLRGDSIRCNQCSREWPRSEWLRLGDLLNVG